MDVIADTILKTALQNKCSVAITKKQTVDSSGNAVDNIVTVGYKFDTSCFAQDTTQLVENVKHALTQAGYVYDTVSIVSALNSEALASLFETLNRFQGVDAEIPTDSNIIEPVDMNALTQKIAEMISIPNIRKRNAAVSIRDTLAKCGDECARVFAIIFVFILAFVAFLVGMAPKPKIVGRVIVVNAGPRVEDKIDTGRF